MRRFVMAGGAFDVGVRLEVWVSGVGHVNQENR